MKTSIKIAAIAALSLTASQALAFETDVERVGMLYLNIPLSNYSSAPKMDKSVLGFRFGQTRLSTDRAGSLFTYFRSRPALFDVQFGMVGRINAPDDIHFGLMDLKLTGISSIEKTYINGQAVVGGVIASKVLIGTAAVAGIGVAAAASGGSSSSDNSSSQSDPSKSSDHTSANDDSSNHELADNENEVEHENEIDDDNLPGHDANDIREIDDDNLPGHVNDNVSDVEGHEGTS
ncbi:hypothetical protein BMS3Bbin11_01163 [bacterium BMS3Bbin11]|nr:hypothetical protein BMS3Bbin11_01163 [bacterium BMS3Bbin11]